MPLLRLTEQMFGYNPTANKIFIIIIGLVLAGWIFYTLNLSAFVPPLPKIKLHQDEKPQSAIIKKQN